MPQRGKVYSGVHLLQHVRPAGECAGRHLVSNHCKKGASAPQS